jgi:endoglucanase
VAPDVDTLQGLYEEVVAEIRKVDKKHLIFLEGNMWGTQFKGLKSCDSKLVWACHIYTSSDFENIPYPHEGSNSEAIARSYKPRADFARRQGQPMWCGEFGAHHHAKDPAVKRGRLQTIDDQITLFEGHGHSWSMWTYKDVGIMGLATLDPRSEYMRRTAPVRRLKEKLGVDQWTADRAGFAKWIKPIAERVKKACGRRVSEEAIDRAVSRRIRDACGILLVEPFAEQFRGMSKPQIDSMMKSWKLANCRINRGLVALLKKHSA